MSTLTSKIQSVSLIGVIVIMLSALALIPTSMVNWEKILLYGIILIPFGTYVSASKIEKLIQKLRILRKKPSEREIWEASLLKHKQELLLKLEGVTKELDIIHSEEAQLDKLAQKVVKESTIQFATKEDVKKVVGMIYDLDKKIKNSQGSNTQISTTEENTPRINGTQNT